MSPEAGTPEVVCLQGCPLLGAWAACCEGKGKRVDERLKKIYFDTSSSPFAFTLSTFA